MTWLVDWNVLPYHPVLFRGALLQQPFRASLAVFVFNGAPAQSTPGGGQTFFRRGRFNFQCHCYRHQKTILAHVCVRVCIRVRACACACVVCSRTRIYIIYGSVWLCTRIYIITWNHGLRACTRKTELSHPCMDMVHTHYFTSRS